MNGGDRATDILGNSSGTNNGSDTNETMKGMRELTTAMLHQAQ